MTFCSIGENYRVRHLLGEAAVRQHLNERGFSVGSPVSVISRFGGNLIVKVKEALHQHVWVASPPFFC